MYVRPAEIGEIVLVGIWLEELLLEELAWLDELAEEPLLAALLEALLEDEELLLELDELLDEELDSLLLELDELEELELLEELEEELELLEDSLLLELLEDELELELEELLDELDSLEEVWLEELVSLLLDVLDEELTKSLLLDASLDELNSLLDEDSKDEVFSELEESSKDENSLLEDCSLLERPKIEISQPVKANIADKSNNVVPSFLFIRQDPLMVLVFNFNNLLVKVKETFLLRMVCATI